MFWNDQSFSHDDALTAYEQDGTLTSFNQMSDLESDDIAGSPPEHSMFWEGGTEKIEPPEQGVPEEKLNLKKKEVEGETINIVPVRYAIDEIEDPKLNLLQSHLDCLKSGRGKAQQNTVRIQA
ncbi:hypothetical protein N779_08545 [Vibrio coralliilyticus OCN008]|nr:hypothetical protein N779_08545 [Vibrio coralliilyticus OCN008]